MITKKLIKRSASRQSVIKEKKQRKPLNVKVLIYSFIVTLVLYALMLFIERTVLESVDYTMVYVAGRDIEKNTTITASNIDDFFSRQERRSDYLPQGCVTDAGQLIGRFTQHAIVKNEIITISALADVDRRVEKIKEPVEVSMNASILSQVVGGVLREGDRINIWSVTEKNQNGEGTIEAEKICDYVYVTRVFTAAGVEVGTNSKEDDAAMVVNIVIPAEKEEDFNIALEKGTLRIGRCMYDREGEEDGDRK